MKQRTKALQFIRAEIAAGRPFPAHAAIARHMGWKNASSASDALWALVKDGHLSAVQTGRNFRWALAPAKGSPPV